MGIGKERAYKLGREIAETGMDFENSQDLFGVQSDEEIAEFHRGYRDHRRMELMVLGFMFILAMAAIAIGKSYGVIK